MPPTYEYKCDTCESVTVELFKMADKPKEITCACGGTAPSIISLPNRAFREAYLDGTKRSGWDKLKEASKMNKEMANQKTEKNKQEIAKEIKKLGVKLT